MQRGLLPRAPGQREHVDAVARARIALVRHKLEWDERRPARCAQRRTGADRDVLLAVHGVGDGEAVRHRRQPRLPQLVAGPRVIREDVAVPVADEHQPPGRGQRRGVVGRGPAPAPQRLAAAHADDRQLADVIRTARVIVVLPFANPAGAAAAFAALDVEERRGLAVQVERDVERLGVRVVAHRAQALEATGARAEIDDLADLLDHSVAVGDLPGIGIDVDQVLIPEINGVDELAGYPIELP